MKHFHVVFSYEIEATKRIGEQSIQATLGSELGSMIVDAEVYPNKEETTNTVKDYIEMTKTVKRPNVYDWKVNNINIIFVREFTEQEHEAYIA